MRRKGTKLKCSSGRRNEESRNHEMVCLSFPRDFSHRRDGKMEMNELEDAGISIRGGIELAAGQELGMDTGWQMSIRSSPGCDWRSAFPYAFTLIVFRKV